MIITYSIQVCNESRELYSVLSFLLKVKDEEDYINVVVDSLHKTEKVDKVLKYFANHINIFERPFDNFYDNSTYHGTVAKGDYVFSFDADEMPQEILIKNIKKIIEDSEADLVWIPRINIHPGITQEYIQSNKIIINDMGWINWPDYQGRIYKKCDYIQWSDELHTKLKGAKKSIPLSATPQLALWHIKSMEKQESCWQKDDSGDFNIFAPTKENLYDQLM